MILANITLPDDFYWEDEFSWEKIARSSSYGTTGSLFIQESEKQDGRPITLTSSSAYISRSTLEALHIEKNTLNNSMTLTFEDGRSFSVMFQEGESLETEPINKTTKVASDDIYLLKSLKLREVTGG